MKKVKAWGDLTSRENWDDDFTPNSNGPVDLMWASREVLLALPGMTEPVVNAFLQLRRGPDGIDGTIDDAQFKSIDEIRAVLNLNPDQFKAMAGLVSIKDPVYRIISVGTSGDMKRTVQMVVRKVGAGATPQMITWKENGWPRKSLQPLRRKFSSFQPLTDGICCGQARPTVRGMSACWTSSTRP